MAGEKSTRKSRRRKKRGRSSSSTSPSSDDISNQPVEGRGHGGLVASPSEAPSGLPDYEWGWHNTLFVGTENIVDIMASVRDQLLCTCFICAILYAAEQDIARWLAIEEPDRHPQIYFDFDTYVEQYETEVQNLLGQDVRFFYRTRDLRPKNALNVFRRDGVLAYSKSKEWLGGQIIKISSFMFHKDMTFPEFEDIIATGGSVIGGFPVGPEFKDLKPDQIYEFSPIDTKRQPVGAHMVQFIGTGIDAGREFLVFLNSKKRFGKNGVGKVYFDQIYNGVYTLQCRAPPPPPLSDDSGLIVAGPDDNVNDDTLGPSGAASDGKNMSSFSGATNGNNMPSFSGATDGNNTSSSTTPTKSLSKVEKCNIYDDDTASSSCDINIDGWVPSAPALLIEDIQTRKCASVVKIERPWKKKNLDDMGTVTRYFVPSNKMNDLRFKNVLLKFYDKVSKNQHGQKHKQPILSSGPANSSGIMNITSPFPSLACSTAFTNTLSMPLMHHNASISRRLVVFGADATGARESPTDQIVDMHRLLEDDWLGHKVDLFLLPDDSAGPRDARSRCMACTKAGASTENLACFHFLSDGKLLATGDHNMKLGRLPLDLAAVQDCQEEVGMMFPSTSPNLNVLNWSTEAAISHAKFEDKMAMEKCHPEMRKGLLKSQADTAFNQKEHKALHIFGLAICHKESAILYANRSVCKLLTGDSEGALSDALRCRILRPDCAKSCYRQAAALMLLKDYAQPRHALLDAQKLDPGNAEIESELRKAREPMKNTPREGV